MRPHGLSNGSCELHISAFYTILLYHHSVINSSFFRKIVHYIILNDCYLYKITWVTITNSIFCRIYTNY